MIPQVAKSLVTALQRIGKRFLEIGGNPWDDIENLDLDAHKIILLQAVPLNDIGWDRDNIAIAGATDFLGLRDGDERHGRPP
jgi:hypothetical protein